MTFPAGLIGDNCTGIDSPELDGRDFPAGIQWCAVFNGHDGTPIHGYGREALAHTPDRQTSVLAPYVLV